MQNDIKTILSLNEHDITELAKLIAPAVSEEIFKEYLSEARIEGEVG